MPDMLCIFCIMVFTVERLLKFYIFYYSPKYEFYMKFTLSAIRFKENENLQSDFNTVI